MVEDWPAERKEHFELRKGRFEWVVVDRRNNSVCGSGSYGDCVEFASHAEAEVRRSSEVR
jgi:hypothetical protein